MQKSYVVKSPINFADFGFFVRVGDILVHDTANHNRLTVYRNGEIVKSITQTSLGMAALVKNQFITEVTAASTPQSSPNKAASAAPAPKTTPSKPAAAPPAPKKETGFTAAEYTPDKKAAKAVPKEIPADQLPERLKEALALDKKEAAKTAE